jgi:hypothetical protein
VYYVIVAGCSLILALCGWKVMRSHHRKMRPSIELNIYDRRLVPLSTFLLGGKRKMPR